MRKRYGGTYEKDRVANTRKTGWKYEKMKWWKYEGGGNGGKTKKYPSLLPRRCYSCGQGLDCVVGLNRNMIGLV